MEPEIASSKYIRLLQQLDDARKTGKLAMGMKEVWNTATHRRGTLLLVEEDYPVNSKEVIDDVIEKVLRSGGDVEFVQPGMLAAYQHIALIG
jgi:ribosomal protein L7Ae-like RNA K-turn-binding protein